MSASQALPLSAIVFQFAAALQRYEEGIDELVRGPFDSACYHRVSALIDEMRLYAASLPNLSAAWIEVLIRHFELTQGLFRSLRDEVPQDLAPLQAQSSDAVQRLARKCHQMMARA